MIIECKGNNNLGIWGVGVTFGILHQKPKDRDHTTV